MSSHTGGSSDEPGQAASRPPRRLSAESLARAFDNARRAFQASRRRRPHAEPEPLAAPTPEETRSVDAERPRIAEQPTANSQPPVLESVAPAAEYDPPADAPWPDEPAADGEVTPLGLVEAMIFVGDPSGAPLTAERIAALLRGVSPAEVGELVERLNRQYEANACPYEISAAGGGFVLSLREEFESVRTRYYGRTRAARLSQAAIEVLAAVAYHEPLTSDEVARLRGTPSGPILAQLVRRQLLRVERGETKPRVSRYYTTPRFLSLFGLESLKDLPQSEELNQR